MRQESKHNTKESHQGRGYKQERKEQERKREGEESRKRGELQKHPGNSLKSGSKYTPTNNQFKCKWTKFLNQTTQSGLMDKKKQDICLLPIDIHFRSKDAYRLKVKVQKKYSPCKWKQKESWSNHIHIRQKIL